MNIKRIIIKIYMMEDIDVQDMQGVIAGYIDSYLATDEEFMAFHKKKDLKAYCYDLPTPIEKGMKYYKKGEIYQFCIRTADENLAGYLLAGIAEHKTSYIKGLERTVAAIPKKYISEVFTLTPLILKNPDGKGYWRDRTSLEGFEQELNKSMISQYEKYTGEKLESDCVLYNHIEMRSKNAIGVKYKNIKLLGDKISMQVADNETAQKVIRFALANGLGEMGSRGMGFLGYRFM